MRLIIGRNGGVGSYLYKDWASRGIDVWGTSRNPVDILQGSLYLDLEKGDFPSLYNYNFDVVIVAAAMTRIHECEIDPEKAKRINIENTLQMINAISERTDCLVFLSTSRVFDGKSQAPTVSSPTNPTTIYGQTKLYVEEVLARDYPTFTNLRLSKVVDETSGLLKDWHTKVRQQEKINAFSDMYMTPTYLEEVAVAIETIIDQKYTGVQHLVPRKSQSYADFAKLWCRRHGYDDAIIQATYRQKDFPEYCCLG